MIVGGIFPYTYLWTAPNGSQSTSSTYFMLEALPGVYTVSVEDHYGNIASDSITIASSPIPSLVNQTNISCYGGSDGKVILTASGGQSPYQYSLNNGPYQSSSVFSNLSAGTYTFFVQDSAGCVASIYVTLTQPCMPFCPSTNYILQSNLYGTRNLLPLRCNQGFVFVKIIDQNSLTVK